jgi:hypothetical protein
MARGLATLELPRPDGKKKFKTRLPTGLRNI